MEGAGLDDDDLVARLRDGDEGARELLFQRTLPGAVLAALTKVSDRDMAYEAATMAFDEVLRRYEPNGRSTFRALVYRYAGWRAKDLLRRRQQHRRVAEEEARFREVELPVGHDELPANDEWGDPWSAIERAERHRLARRAVEVARRHLAATDSDLATRRTFVLHHRLEELSGRPHLTGKELAAAFGCDVAQITRDWQALLGIMQRAVEEEEDR